jgi:hypothetical protein
MLTKEIAFQRQHTIILLVFLLVLLFPQVLKEWLLILLALIEGGRHQNRVTAVANLGFAVIIIIFSEANRAFFYFDWILIQSTYDWINNSVNVLTELTFSAVYSLWIFLRGIDTLFSKEFYPIKVLILLGARRVGKQFLSNYLYHSKRRLFVEWRRYRCCHLLKERSVNNYKRL